MEQTRLSDGTILPRGTRIAFASAAIAMDPSVNMAPEQFDGFRSLKKRQRDLESLAAACHDDVHNKDTVEKSPTPTTAPSAAAILIKNKHSMAVPDKERLIFGHGKQACPGRFFAVNEMKMILARFLIGYEFKYPAGKLRPRNFFLEEYIVPDPRAKLMMRNRQL